MAGGANFGGDEEEMITGINVTPLVDVVLVLLIILMVTATAIVSKTIPMDLPQASTGEPTEQSRTLAVSIDQQGKLFLDREPVSATELRSKIKAARKDAKEVRAVLAADGQTAHSNVVKVIDILRSEKVTKFAINVKPEELEK